MISGNFIKTIEKNVDGEGQLQMEKLLVHQMKVIRIKSIVLLMQKDMDIMARI